ncbi:hypothetical protein METBIDRAFT_33110 [Metschnikowia bicuspidata var. bicuspidata NRRL YB-4993]|uniref:ferric-chelate reductase (NADPH) n=1 Tax=Metschnikowia bicuspidata var. bicuspidata NRRL YB-4993 TaxID=869754 RepID=A0A1A0H683_9ASCO|nr:hypothetical protein METBIDRAFT_33110 [Metschnikowia bicuspidata var. bicuspidata NRRL YB-4993]OBA19417.1 hypothetical protein METBIDRAFT_33110 [Metschnikowia bicuspidata var. bicuspidata NRRL YB-4993]
MKNFDWGCGGTGQGHKMYLCRCHNVDWVGSVSNCMETQGSDNQETRHAWKHLATRCLQKADLHFTVDQLEDYLLNATQYMEAPPTNMSTRLYLPISVNHSDYEIYKTSFDDINHHVFKSQWLGWGLVLFWGAYVAYLTVSNILWTWMRVSVFPKTARQWYQKHMLKTTWVFGLLRWDVLLMAAFVVQAVLCTALSYTVSLPNMYINDVYFLTLDLIGYRSGLLAFSLMPVVFVFGLRNNPFCWMTGLPQANFITYHKLVALVMSLEALVHSAVWTAYAIRSGGYAAWGIDDYWRWGVVGTVLVFVMLGQSVGLIRNLMYELFLVVHKLFGWLFIVSMWYHCNILGWMGWVYSLIAFTAYDRVIRLFKTFFINRGYTKIQMTMVDRRVIKMTVPKSELHNAFYKPGSHIFISFYHWPIWYQCFQSHPFTIVNSPVESEGVFVIYIRVKKGTTCVLAKLKGDEKGRLSMWLLIEGPYGNGVPTFKDNEQLVGIAGGLGTCALLATFHHNPRGSVLYWAVNNMADIEYLRRDLEHLIAKGTDVQVFLTRDKGEDDYSIEKEYKYVSVLGERPNTDEWVRAGLELGIVAKKTDTYVLSCGPGAMDSDVQKSVSENTVVGLEHCLHYQRENYQW